ncbi:hypothetical protein I7I51_01102 [Histoplasma capsulatum]|uniref:Uncharacterized protein n=1 Tax=Ajellomyces capsulatus TaxID=5037 RepID=A0A8A1MFW4_AJECA|nr:hypothetical protein I7I51_01102 [Histoplasma capsulatum]
MIKRTSSSKQFSRRNSPNPQKSISISLPSFSTHLLSRNGDVHSSRAPSNHSQLTLMSTSRRNLASWNSALQTETSNVDERYLKASSLRSPNALICGMCCLTWRSRTVTWNR